MKFKITGENGKSIEVDLTEEQMEALGLKQEFKYTGYELGDDKVFFRSLNNGLAQQCHDRYAKTICLDNATAYSDYKLAEDNARADLLMRRLRRYAAQHGGMPRVEDWKVNAKRHSLIYYISYNYANGSLYVETHYFLRGFGGIFFHSCVACEDAIEEFKDELIWYFTKYEAMLH